MSLNRLLSVTAVILALFRLVRLDLVPIFFDEAIYLSEADKITQDIRNLFIAFEGVQFPVMTWILATVNILTRSFSDLLISGRVTSVIFDFGSTYFVYLLGKKIFSQRFGLVSCLVYLSLPLIFIHSRFVMLESPTNFFSLGLIYAFFLTIQVKSWRNYLLIIIFGVLAFFTKPLAVVYWPAAFLVPYFFVNKPLRQTYHNFILPIVFLLLITGGIFFPLAAHFSAHTKVASGLNLSLLADFKLNLHKFWLWSLFYLTPLVLVTCVFGFFFGFPRQRSRLSWLAIWLVSVAILDSFVGSHLYPRHLYPLAAPIALLTTWGIKELTKINRFFASIFFLTIMGTSWIKNFQFLTTPAASLVGEDRQQFYQDWSSGVGLKEVATKFRSLSRSQNINLYVENDSLTSWALPKLFPTGKTNFQLISNLPKVGSSQDLILINRNYKLINNLKLNLIEIVKVGDRRPFSIYQYISQ